MHAFCATFLFITSFVLLFPLFTSTSLMKNVTFFAFQFVIGAVALNAEAQSYGLDPTFGTAGVATVTFPTASATDALYGLAVQPDGKLVLAGQNNTSFGLARLTANGLPDTGFGTIGTTTTPVMIHNPGTTNNYATPATVLIQADGKIMVAGSVTTSSPGPNWRAYARYTATGALDVSYAAQGNYYGSPGIFIPFQGSGGFRCRPARRK